MAQSLDPPCVPSSPTGHRGCGRCLPVRRSASETLAGEPVGRLVVSGLWAGRHAGGSPMYLHTAVQPITWPGHAPHPPPLPQPCPLGRPQAAPSRRDSRPPLAVPSAGTAPSPPVSGEALPWTQHVLPLGPPLLTSPWDPFSWKPGTQRTPRRDPASKPSRPIGKHGRLLPLPPQLPQWLHLGLCGQPRAGPSLGTPGPGPWPTAPRVQGWFQRPCPCCGDDLVASGGLGGQAFCNRLK